MRDGTCPFFQMGGIFHYFRAFKTEILHIYSLIGQIQKQLSPSVSVTSAGYEYDNFVGGFCATLIMRALAIFILVFVSNS